MRFLLPWALAAGLSLAASNSAYAQGNCQRNGNGVCAVGGTATYGLSLTITKAARLTTSSTTVPLPSPTAAQYDTTFGTPASLGLIINSNTPWSLLVSGAQATWTAGGGGRVNKPVGDLQYAFALGGPFTNLTTTGVSVLTGTATASATYTMYFRVRYSWNVDNPGTYSMPVQLVLSAP